MSTDAHETDDQNSLIAAEHDRAEALLEAVTNQSLDLITVHSAGPDRDAVFLGRNISKVSPFVSSQLENAIVDLLMEQDSGSGLAWARQEPGFPDSGITREGVQTGHGIEVKAWFPLATELTARFKASQTFLAGKQVKIIVCAWILDHIVHGKPVLLDFVVIDALDLARHRDVTLHNPPFTIITESEDSEDRGVHMRVANATCLTMQNKQTSSEVQQAMAILGGRSPEPFSEEGVALTAAMRNLLTYREHSNFGKLQRMHYPALIEFRERVNATEFRGMTIATWKTVLAGLDSTNEFIRDSSMEIVKGLYDDEGDSTGGLDTLVEDD